MTICPFSSRIDTTLCLSKFKIFTTRSTKVKAIYLSVSQIIWHRLCKYKGESRKRKEKRFRRNKIK